MRNNYGRHMYVIKGIKIGLVVFRRKIYDLDNDEDANKVFS